eukprot:1064_1
MIIFMLVVMLMTTTSSLPYPTSFDCPMRKLAVEFAQKIQPFLSIAQLQQIIDALNGAPESRNCNLTLDKINLNLKTIKNYTSSPIWNDIDYSSSSTIFIDYINGNDVYNGSMNYPLKHLETAVKFSRAYATHMKKTLVLRKGTHYIPNTIFLTSHDTNILITNYDNEYVEISAALPLNCTWTKYNSNKNGTYYQCQLSNNVPISDIYGLRVNGKRAIRARYPNGNPETYPCGFCSNLNAKSWIGPKCNTKPVTKIYPNAPYRTDQEANLWDYYQLGIGSDDNTHCCDMFTPNAGFWCYGDYSVTSGLVYDKTILPNTPYLNATNGYIHAWHPGYWNTWMFEIEKDDAINNRLLFSRGGFQGGRSSDSGGHFYIENVLEELDFPTEYFFNTSTKVLYYYHNETNGQNISNLVFEATNLKVIMNYTGTSNHEIRGITFKDTAYTFMDQHGMPSGGDWSLQRQGALYFDNVSNIFVNTNNFTRLDGNTISINKYARNVSIYRNVVVYNGDNVISLWGDTQPITNFTDNGNIKTSMGWDGTGETQPRGIQIIQNFIHEIGIFEKQSSMYFQAKSCSNILDSNVFFNGPRAAINFNDGFGGNSTIKNNLIFNMVRESSDHGPFNSWDRQLYVTKVGNYNASNGSVIKAWDYIYNNFIIANYNGLTAIDNDDGSCYYKMYSNFFVYGSSDGLKNQWGGHDEVSFNNIYAYIGLSCFCIHYELPGHIDYYFNNTCIINQNKLTKYKTDYGTFGGVTDPSNYPNLNFYSNCSISSASFPVLGNNTIHILSNDSNDISQVGLCEINLSEFQTKYNNDIGTLVKGYPDNNAIINQAKSLLWT